MSNKRTPIGNFIHSSWTSINIRCGKYKHLSNKSKNKCYENIIVEFTQYEYKTWCLKHEVEILKLQRPSVNRIDSKQNYKLSNIEIIELAKNISMKKPGTAYLNGPKSKTLRGVKKSGKKFSARITIHGQEYYIGTFETKKAAYQAFRDGYVKYYGKEPW